MKSSVEVNGVVLTRAQVEEAWKKLNEPDPITLTKVERYGGNFRFTLSNGQMLDAQLRGSGSHYQRGVFLPLLYSDALEWKIITDDQGALVLTLAPKETT